MLSHGNAVSRSYFNVNMHDCLLPGHTEAYNVHQILFLHATSRLRMTYIIGKLRGGFYKLTSPLTAYSMLVRR